MSRLTLREKRKWIGYALPVVGALGLLWWLSPGIPVLIGPWAWAGEKQVRAVDASVDFGASWSPMEVKPPANKYAWQRWSGRVGLPQPGYYEVWYRATDSDGAMQTLAAGNWNPQGYGGNPMHRVAIRIA